MTVLVVGNATVDLSFEVDHLPEPGETLLARNRLVDAGGKGLNQAVVARRAGAEVVYIAGVGDDADAAVIRGRLAEEGLADRLLVRRGGATDQSIITLALGGENAIVSTAGMAASVTTGEAAAALDALGPGDVLLMQGNLRRETTEGCLVRAAERGACVLLNPAPIAFDYGGLWPFVDVAVVNELEGRLLGGRPEPPDAAEALLARGAGTVVVTLGAAGALVATPAGCERVPAPAVAAVDTTGAGDVFCGVLAAALDRGRTLVEAVRPAVAAASLSVTRRGTTSAFPSAVEILRILGEA